MHLFLIIELLKRFLYQTSWQVNGCSAFVAVRLLPRVCCYAFVATRLLLLSENVLMLENVKTITLNEKLCRRCNFVNRSMATKIRITQYLRARLTPSNPNLIFKTSLHQCTRSSVG